MPPQITLIRPTPLTSVIYLFNAAIVGTVAFLPFKSHRISSIESNLIAETVIEQINSSPITRAQLHFTFWFLEPILYFILNLNVEQVILASIWSAALFVAFFPVIWLVCKGLKLLYRNYLRDRSWKAMAVEIAQSLILNLDTFEMLAQEHAPNLVFNFDMFCFTTIGLLHVLMFKYLTTLIIKVCFRALDDFINAPTFDLKISYNYDTPSSESSLTQEVSEETLQEIERQLALNLSFPSFQQKEDYYVSIVSDVESSDEDVDRGNKSDSGYSSVGLIDLTEEEMKYHPNSQYRNEKMIVVEENVVDAMPGSWLSSYANNLREIYIGQSDGMRRIRRHMTEDRKQGYPNSLLYVYGLTLDDWN